MENAVVTEATNEMCASIYTDYPEGPRDFYVYAEVDDGVIAPSLVQIYSDHIFWIAPWDIGDPLYRMWQNADADKKWQAMTLEIRDGKFDAKFIYDPARHFDEETDARSMAAMHEKFPDLPVRYPPFDPDAYTLEARRRRAARQESFVLDSPSEIDTGSKED